MNLSWNFSSSWMSLACNSKLTLNFFWSAMSSFLMTFLVPRLLEISNSTSINSGKLWSLIILFSLLLTFTPFFLTATLSVKSSPWNRLGFEDLPLPPLLPIAPPWCDAYHVFYYSHLLYHSWHYFSPISIPHIAAFLPIKQFLFAWTWLFVIPTTAIHFHPKWFYF